MKHLRLNPHLLTVPAYIAGKPIELVQEEYGLQDIIKLGSNENPLGPSPLAAAALQEAIQAAHRYPGVADKKLREKLAVYFNARYSTSFTEQNFLTGNGLSDILRMIAQAFIFDNGEAIYCDPTFPLYSIFTKMLGGIATAVSHDRYRYNLRAIADATTERTRVIFICNPNNPTGTIVTQDEIEEFMRHVPPTALVVFDESYCDFATESVFPNTVQFVQDAQDNVLVLRGFSKAYGLANLRIGYALGTPAMIHYLSHAQLVFNTGDLVLRAATAALDDQAHLHATCELIAREREFLYQCFSDLDLSFVPSQANFILLVNLPMDVKTLNERMLQRGVIIRPMASFGMPNSIRVTLGTREQNQRLVQTLGQALEQ